MKMSEIENRIEQIFPLNERKKLLMSSITLENMPTVAHVFFSEDGKYPEHASRLSKVILFLVYKDYYSLEEACLDVIRGVNLDENGYSENLRSIAEEILTNPLEKRSFRVKDYITKLYHGIDNASAYKDETNLESEIDRIFLSSLTETYILNNERYNDTKDDWSAFFKEILSEESLASCFASVNGEPSMLEKNLRLSSFLLNYNELEESTERNNRLEGYLNSKEIPDGKSGEFLCELIRNILKKIRESTIN